MLNTQWLLQMTNRAASKDIQFMIMYDTKEHKNLHVQEALTSIISLANLFPPEGSRIDAKFEYSFITLETGTAARQEKKSQQGPHY